MQFLQEEEEVWIPIPEESELCRKLEKNVYKRSFSMAQEVPSEINLIGLL